MMVTVMLSNCACVRDDFNDLKTPFPPFVSACLLFETTPLCTHTHTAIVNVKDEVGVRARGSVFKKNTRKLIAIQQFD